MQLSHVNGKRPFGDESVSYIRTGRKYLLSACVVGILLVFCVLLTSCGGGGSATKLPPSVAATITAQPVSQTVPVNRAAMFSVTAGGTAPLLYQWYRNGAAIGGANEATFNTPVVTLLDNKTTYSVTISNSAGSVTSATVTLLAGPRAPAMGDLRYLQLEQAPLYNNSAYQLSGVELGAVTQSGTGFLGDALSMGNVVRACFINRCGLKLETFVGGGLFAELLA